MHTDASKHGVGAVLSQLDDEGLDHTISYFSRKTSTARGTLCHSGKGMPGY